MNVCLKETIKNEGFFGGLFRGIGQPMVFVSVLKMVTFGVFEESKRFLSEFKESSSVSSLSSTLFIYDGNWNIFCSGFAAGGVSAALSAPLEFVKVRVQLARLINPSLQQDKKSKLKGNIGTAIELIKNNSKGNHFQGLMALYSGSSLQFVRDSFGTGIYFILYYFYREQIEQNIEELLKVKLGKDLVNGGNDFLLKLGPFFAGGFAGVSSWSLLFPVDLVKSRVQRSFINPTFLQIRQVVHDLWMRKGIVGFYSGLSTTMIRAFPIHAAYFFVYESVMRYLKQNEMPEE